LNKSSIPTFKPILDRIHWKILSLYFNIDSI